MGNRVLEVTQGTFTTSNFSVVTGVLRSNNSNIRTINLGSSTVNLGTNTPLDFAVTTNLTFNAGTSQINLGSTLTTFAGAGLTYHNVSFNMTGTSTNIITGVNTFNNLTFTGPAAIGLINFRLDDRQIVNGTFSTTGTAGNRRIWFRSANYGIALPLLTINGNTTGLTDADFRDVIVTGTAAPISGTRIGDLRGNSGITFSAPKTVFRIGTGNWSDDQWAATSGGAVSTDNFPLAQDIAVFNESTSAGTHTLNAAIGYISTIDMSARTSALTISIGASQTVFGNWTNGSGITLSGTPTLTFSGRNTQTITTAGREFPDDIVIDTFGGTVTLADALIMNTSVADLIVTNGTFSTANFNITVRNLSSSNSNVRTINLGSSTVTLGGTSSAIGFGIATNLTFNAGTSQINLLAGSTGSIFSGGGQTFFNVSFTNTGSGATPSITGTNTFNNLTIAPPTGTLVTVIRLVDNQTVTGTLTVAGGSPIRRIFLRSDTLGTPRTLSVGTLAATDCDFRDIVLTGTAAGSSPTRAGNCGGNSGITFPAPKTVYWNLAGTQNWSATGWASSSGGTPNINNFPLAQDTAIFDNTGAAGTITVNTDWNIGTVNSGSRTTAMTLNYGGVVHGSWTTGTGVTLGTGLSMAFRGRGTSTITSNGQAFNGAGITFDCATGTVQLGDALTLVASQSLQQLSGSFNAVTFNVTVGNFGSFQGTAGLLRTLTMGSGTWTVTGAGTSAWFITDITSINFDKGTANIVLSDNTTASRIFSGGGLSYNKLTIGGNTSTSTTTISENNQFTELASTKTVAHTIDLGTTIQTFGAWTVTGTVGNVVTLTGTGTFHMIAGAAVSGINYLAMGSIGFSAASMGEFYAGANSTGTAGAPVYRTAKPADSIRYWVGGTGNWSDTARWSTGSGGAGGASVPRSHDDVVFNSASNATAYTATVNLVTGGIRCKSLTITGPASGNLTLAGTTGMFIHNNVSLPATGLTRTYTGNITLTGSTTGRTFTTNGVALASTIAIDGVGCEWLLGSALDNASGSSTILVRNGTFDLANFNLTTGSILSFETVNLTANYNSRTIKFGSSTLTISASVNFGTSTTVGESVARSLTFDAGTSQINFTSTSPTIAGNGKTFHNVSFTSTARTGGTIAGTPVLGGTPTTFNNLTIAGRASAGVSNVFIDLPGTTVVSGTLTVSAGTNATCRTFIRSTAIGTTRTITCAAFSGTDVDFRDITITGTAAPISGTRLGNCRGNSGITFPAGTIKYWNLAAGGSWSSTGWATASGGTPAVNNFPLAQDTCVFEATGLNSGASVSFDASFNVGTIDMSARTTNTMTLSVGLNTIFVYGNWINGTGSAVSTAASVITFAGRGAQTITSAGISALSFTPAITVDSPGGTVTLLDAYNSTNQITITRGTFDAGSFNVTIGNLAASGSETRTIAIGSGTWSIPGVGATAWNTGTSTNLTVTGSGTINMSGGTAKTFAGGGANYSGITLNQGGTGDLTITGNNTFRDITATRTSISAASILLGTTTQSVTQFRGKGEATRLLTIQGTSVTSPATLIYTGSGPATDTSVDYLSLLGVRAYPLTNTWYAGNNSINNGTLGWEFTSTPATTTSGNFLLFVMPRAA
jgi:hypothetical protein